MRPVHFLALACTLAGALTLGSSHARAQSTGLTLDLSLDEPIVLPGEDIPVGVRISNLTGRPIKFGTSSNWLIFHVESKRGDMVSRLGMVPVAGEFTLESSKAGTKWWNIQPWFDFDRSGLYVITAELRLPEWDQHLVSDPLVFTLQPSTKLWETPFGVPLASGESTPTPEIRRYALQAATRSKERKLFVRVSDETDSHIYKVVLLDRLLSFANPQQQLDANSKLHVLFQTGGTIYTYCVVNPDGEVIVRQRHEITPGSRPHLAKTEDGSIGVAGGRRLGSPSDVPPYQPPLASLDTNATTAVTNAPAPDAKSSKNSKKHSSKTPLP